MSFPWYLLYVPVGVLVSCWRFNKNQKNPSIESDTTCLLDGSMSECSNSDLARQPQNHQAAIYNGSDSTEAKNQRFAKNLSSGEGNQVSADTQETVFEPQAMVFMVFV